MKAYTDIEQSKKLAEILPIESADMHYAKVIHGFDLSKDWVYEIQLCAPSEKNHIPAWSLAALLEQLDFSIINEQEEDLVLQIEKEGLQYYLHYDNEYTGDVCEIETLMYDDLVDACVEMIIKLKEKKLL